MVSLRCSLCTSCHQGCSPYSLWDISKKTHVQRNANDHYDGSICVDRALNITMMGMLPWLVFWLSNLHLIVFAIFTVRYLHLSLSTWNGFRSIFKLTHSYTRPSHKSHSLVTWWQILHHNFLLSVYLCNEKELHTDKIYLYIWKELTFLYKKQKKAA